MKEQIINQFLSYEFIYIFSFCSLTFLSLSIIIKKNIIKKISMLLFSIFFILFVFEFILSFVLPIPKIDFYKDYIKLVDKNIVCIKSDIRKIEDYKRNDDDFKKRPKDIVYDVTYSIYDNIYRYVKCNKDSNDTFLFLGDSFIFGDGLYDDETLPYYFSQIYGFDKNIINCGVRAKSSTTALNIINTENFVNLMSNKSQIKHFFYGLIKEHIYRNFRYFDGCSDIYRYENNNFVLNREPNFFLKYYFARSYIFRKIFLPEIEANNEKYYKKFLIKDLQEINTIVEKKYDSKLTIIVWPEFDNFFISELKKTNIDLIFLPKCFNSEKEGYRIKYDGHPTGKANKEIAQILYNHINEIDNKSKEN